MKGEWVAEDGFWKSFLYIKVDIPNIVHDFNRSYFYLVNNHIFDSHLLVRFKGNIDLFVIQVVEHINSGCDLVHIVDAIWEVFEVRLFDGF